MSIGFGSSEVKEKKAKGRSKVGTGLTERQKKYLRERLKGSTKKYSALAAGYSVETAENALQKIETPALRAKFAALVDRVIPEAKMLQRLDEGLDATVTTFAKEDGQITDAIECVDFEQRRKYLELTLGITGRFDSKAAVNVAVPIVFKLERIER